MLSATEARHKLTVHVAVLNMMNEHSLEEFYSPLFSILSTTHTARARARCSTKLAGAPQARGGAGRLSAGGSGGSRLQNYHFD